MRLPSFIKKIFTKKTAHTSAISSFSSLITIPTREEFQNSQEKISLLDEIKATYQERISTKKSIVSSQLEIDSLREKMNMYINLMFSLLEVDELNLLSLSDRTVDQDSIKNFTYFIKMAKLKLYFYNIINLETETTLRLVALKELSEELTIFSRTKKRAIAEEINNLSGALIVFLNQRQAISIELENYLKEYSTLKKEETIPDDELSKLITEKHNELLRMLSLIDPNKNSELHRSKPDITSIVLIEQELEGHVYMHKSEVDDIRNLISSLIEETKKITLPKDIQSKVDKLELKCKMFSEYGRKLITDVDIYNLYNLKFNLLTRALITKGDDLEIFLANANFIELSLYQEIIMDRINIILTNRNSEITRLFGNKSVQAINIISSFLKQDKSSFSPDTILSDANMLSFLTSFDFENGFYYYLSRNNASINWSPFYKEMNTFNFNLFSYNKDIPLFTLFWLYLEKEKSTGEAIREDLMRYEHLYKLYKILNSQKQQTISRNCKLPEGITEIKNFEPHALSLYERNFIQNIHKMVNCKTLMFPSTLREINGNLFRHCYIENIILNKGLKKIAYEAFYAVDFNTLTIPASVSEIDYAAFNERNTNELRSEKSRFDDLILEDVYSSSLTDTSIANLIRTFFFVEDETPYKREKEVIENVRIKYKNVSSQPYKSYTSNEMELMKDTLETMPAFERLILRENGEDILILTKKDLTFFVNRLFCYNSALGDISTYQYGDYYTLSEDQDGTCYISEGNDGPYLSKLEADILTQDIKRFLKEKLNSLDNPKTKKLTKE